MSSIKPQWDISVNHNTNDQQKGRDTKLDKVSTCSS